MTAEVLWSRFTGFVLASPLDEREFTPTEIEEIEYFLMNSKELLESDLVHELHLFVRILLLSEHYQECVYFANKISSELILKSSEEVLKTRINCGYAHACLGNIEDAISVFDRIIEFSSQHQPDCNITSSALEGKAHCLTHIGDREEALRLHVQLFHHRMEFMNLDLAAKSCSSIARLNLALNRNEIALEWFERAIFILKDVPTSLRHAYALLELGRYYSNKGHRGKSRSLFSRAMKICERKGSQRGIGNILRAQAEEIAEEKPQEAVELLHHATFCFQQVSDGRRLHEVNSELSDLLERIQEDNLDYTTITE